MDYQCSLCRYYDFYFAECMKDDPCWDAPAPDAPAPDAPSPDTLSPDA